MTDTYKVLKYYFVTVILIVLLTAGMCGFFIAKTNSEFMLFGSPQLVVAKCLYLV